MNKEELLKKIEEQEKMREGFISQVNNKLGEIKGRIAAYQEMIEEMEKTDE